MENIRKIMEFISYGKKVQNEEYFNIFKSVDTLSKFSQLFVFDDYELNQ